MAIKELSNFGDIVEAVRETSGVESNDSRHVDNIKRAINMVYLYKVVPKSRWRWLEGQVDITHKKKYNAGTAEVTEGSTTVTLSVAPTATDGDSGSFVNYRFAVEGYDEVYRIDAHTALSTTVELAVEYTGESNTTAAIKIWRDVLDLPTDCEETVEVYHNFDPRPLDGIGLQRMRDIISRSEKIEGRPRFYTTLDYKDPSSGDGESETDRFRQMRIHPSADENTLTLHIDYKKKVTGLDADADEPVMPASDRIVLYYGALAEVFSIVNRDPEQSSFYLSLFEQKLEQMVGDDSEDSNDVTRVVADSLYVNSIRESGLGGRRRRSQRRDDY